jgi:ABC-type multidrug transport system ATPase subunit
LRDIHHKKFASGPFLKSRLIEETAVNRIAAFDVRPNKPHAICGSLSGGNLQRLILSRELDNTASVLVAVNPTAGLDLAMSQRIAVELKNAAASGQAVVLISPDLQELLGICDRILVMCAGSVVGVERVEDLHAESLGLLVGGVKLDTVRKLAKFLKLEHSSTLDREARDELHALLESDLAWQRRLAAKIIERLSPGQIHSDPINEFVQEVR